jgi:hypothetical protein
MRRGLILEVCTMIEIKRAADHWDEERGSDYGGMYGLR